MDNCLKLFVSIFLCCHISTGRTYRAHYGKPYDSHGQFHHGFEHYDRDSWHNGAPDWDPPPYHRIHFNNARNRHPIIHRNDYLEAREYWRQHHPVTYKYSPGMYMNYPGSFATTPSYHTDTLPPITPSSPFSFLQCMHSCPESVEYNPVCGTNNVTYINLSRLICVKQCGIQVELKLKSKCPSIHASQDESTQPEFTRPFETELPESEDEYWTDIPFTEPAFYYIDHTETTEKNIYDEISDGPTRAPSTESAISKPSQPQKPSSERPKVLPNVTGDAMDQDEDIDIDVRIRPSDDK